MQLIVFDPSQAMVSPTFGWPRKFYGHGHFSQQSRQQLDLPCFVDLAGDTIPSVNDFRERTKDQKKSQLRS